MNTKSIKKVVRKRHDKYEHLGTCCIIDNCIAITARHVAEKGKELYIEVDKGKYIEVSYIPDKKYDFAILKLNNPINIGNYYELNATDILEGDKWITFGFPIPREFQGISINGVVQFAETIEESLYDLELKIEPNESLSSYKGLSGSPLIMDNTIKGIIIQKPDGNSLGAVKVSKCLRLLVENNIKIKTNYSDWIYKLYQKNLVEQREGFTLDRKDLYTSIKNFSLSGNGLIVGDAGVGKSYILRKIAKDLNNQGIPAIYIAIDEFISMDKFELEKELFLDDNELLINKIEKEFKRLNLVDKKAIIIFDSFDSARNEEIKQKFMKLMKEIKLKFNEICNLIVSCRVYDAKQSLKLQEIFFEQGEVKLTQNNLTKCRSITIDKLKEYEVIEAIELICKDKKLYDNLSSSLKEILKVPFNLWLFENIFSQESNLLNINSINSEIDLLDLFWSYKLQGKNIDSLEYLINKITEKMLIKKTLSISKREVYNPQIQEEWTYLLSNSILKTIDSFGNKISFSHNILFDYAVSKVILTDKIDSFLIFLEEDISRIVFLRPSLIYFFINIWNVEKNLFWTLLFDIIKSDKIPIIAMFIPINTIISKVEYVEDLNVIIDKWNNQDEVGIEVVKRILQAIDVFGKLNDRVWINFIYEITKNIKYEHIGLISWNIFKIVDLNIENYNAYNLKICNNIVIDIYSRINQSCLKEEDEWLRKIQRNVLLPIICKTLSISIDKNKEIVLGITKMNNETGEYLNYISQITKNIDYIYDADYKLTEEIFINIFTNSVSNKEVTNMDISNILLLTSNRKQDYEMCKFNLYNNFSRFIDKNSKNGLTLAIKVLNIIVIKESYSDVGNINIKYKDTDIILVKDNSCWWSNCYWSEEITYFTKAIFNHLDKIVKYEEYEKIDEFFYILRKEARVIFIWAQLLKNSSKYPDILKDYVFEICCIKELMLCNDIIYELCEFMKSCSNNLTTDEIKEIKMNIEELSNTITREGYDESYVIERKNRILRSLGEESIKDSLKDSDYTYIQECENKPLVSLSDGDFEKENYEEQLIREGINIENSDDIIVLLKKLNFINMKLLNEKINLDECDNIFKLCIELSEKISNDKYNIKLQEKVWNEIATGIKKSIANETKTYVIENYEIYKKILLHIVSLKLFESEDLNFTGLYSTFISTPKHAAAEILPILIDFKDDIEVLNGIDKLLQHNSLSLRCLCVLNLYRISRNQSDYMWNKLSEIIQLSNEYLNESIAISLRKLVNGDSNKVSSVIMDVPQNIYKDISTRFIDIIIYLYFYKENKKFENIIKEVIKEPWVYKWYENDGISSVLFNYIRFDNLDHANGDIVNDIVKFINSVINVLIENMIDLNNKLKETQLKGELNRDLQNMYKIFNLIIENLYLKSGALEDNNNRNVELEKKYYYNIKPILNNIIIEKKDTVILAPTIHSLIEMLNYLLDYDTSYIVKCISIIISKGRESGYIEDSLAINEMVDIINKILVDYKSEVQNESTLKDVLNILNNFANIGNSNAINFIWRLDEIYR